MAWYDFILTYNTIKTVRIRNQPALSILFHLTRLLIGVYIIVYVIVLNHGYQTSVQLVSDISTKVKGSAFVTASDGSGQTEVWDSTDVVRPAVEQGALFISTNVLQTVSQARGTCYGNIMTSSPGIPGEDCTATKACVPGLATEHGIVAGACNTSYSQYIPGSGVVTGWCPLYAWCPVENDTFPMNPPNNVIQGISQFTVFTRFTARFDLDGTSYVASNANYLNGTNSTINLWYISWMLQNANIDLGTPGKQSTALLKGAVVAMSAYYDCNLRDSMDSCIPSYSFQRLDNPASTVSSGFNYRTADYYRVPSTTAPGTYQPQRDLSKLWGIRFIFLAGGVGRKAGIIPLMLNLASGLALLSLATITTDMVASYLFPKKRREEFLEAKFDDVAFNEMDRNAYFHKQAVAPVPYVALESVGEKK